MTAFLSSSFMHNIFGGLATGVIYSLVALSLVIIWQSTHVLNFAQGAMAMFATYIGMTEIDRGIGYWWCVIISVVVGMALGGLTERVLIRPPVSYTHLQFINIGEFISAVIYFVIYMAVIYYALVVPYRNYMARTGTTVFGPPAPAPDTKSCPECLSSDLPAAATKCLHCASVVA